MQQIRFCFCFSLTLLCYFIALWASYICLRGLFSRWALYKRVKWWFKFIRPYYNFDWIFYYTKYFNADKRLVNDTGWRLVTVASSNRLQFDSSMINLFDRCHCPMKCTSTFFCFAASATTESLLKLAFLRFIPIIPRHTVNGTHLEIFH